VQHPPKPTTPPPINRLESLLDYRRRDGRPDIAAYCKTAALFSVLVASLGDIIEELDMNPIIVHADGCIAVDAMIVTVAQNKTDD